MKKRYSVPFLTLIVATLFFSSAFTFIPSQSNFELPIWLNSSNKGKNLSPIPDIEPISDEDILKSKGNEEAPAWGNKPDRFMGQNVTDAIINFNRSRSSYDSDPYSLYNDLDDLTFPTEGFNISYTNLSFFNIITAGYLQDVETDGLGYGPLHIPPFGGANLPYIDPDTGNIAAGNPWVMSFEIEHGFISYMAGLDIRLRSPNFAALIYCYVLNSTFNGISGQIEPHLPVGSFAGYYSGVNWQWVHCEGLGFLNTPYETVNNTFFVLPGVIDPNMTTSVYWDYMNDPLYGDTDGSDEGIAYLYTTVWELQHIDFCVRQINITGCVPPPSGIDMRINGTILPDGPLLHANVTPDMKIYAYSSNYTNNNLLNGESGHVFFDITTNWSLYGRSTLVVFMINASGQFENLTRAITRCYTTAGDSIVDWNATIEGMYFPNGSYDKKINVTIPKSWNVSGVYHENNTEEIWVNQTRLSFKFVYFNVTANGSWTIDCNGTNWGGDIRVYNNTPPFLEAYSYYLNDTILINGSIHANSPIQANLTIFDPNNLSVHRDRANIVNKIASFSPWQIIQQSKTNGTHYLRVVWFNGTEVGINMTTIFCYKEPTNLSVTQGPDPDVVIQGDPVTARIFYNDTYDDKGIFGAFIDSNWTYSGLNVKDWGNGSYNITFSTQFAPKDNFTIEINATKPGFETATTIIKFNVTLLVILEPTELEIVIGIPYTGEDLYVNDTGKYAIINYTFQVNGSGIKGAGIMTDPDWADKYYQAEDLSLGNASLKGLYKIWLDTTGTHADETHTIKFFASKPSHEPREVTSLTFVIRPIPTIIDVTGYENITKFEGEIVDLAACYKDNYHAGKPAITEATVNWTINTTIPESGDMELVILIYQGTINLPEVQVPPGTYNITIKAEATDFAFNSKNITLNVLPKWDTIITITNTTQTEIRVGKDVTIEAEIEFSNSSFNRKGLKLTYDIEYSNGYHIEEDRITNINGKTFYEINPIPNIRWINVTVSYDGTPQIHANSSALRINVTGKYETNLTINEPLKKYFISGEEVSINATLNYNKSGTWTNMEGENVEFIMDYKDYQDESYLITTDDEGNAFLEFMPPEKATSVIIRTKYQGNVSFYRTNDNSTSFKITKYNVSLEIIFDFHPIEMMVGNPLVLACKLIYSMDNVILPISNATLTFFIFTGSSDVKIFTVSAVTNEEGIATMVLPLLEPFQMIPILSVGVEYEGDESNSMATTSSALPTIPMTTTKYVMNFINEYWIWMVIGVCGIVAISLAYRYGYKLPRRRELIVLQKKIANKVKDAQNLKHAMIVHKDSGTAIFGQGFGVELDSDLISGFLTAISAFRDEIGVKGKKKAEKPGGFELNYADFKILLTDGELSRFAFILQERPSEGFRQTAQETTNEFEKGYRTHLREWDGALKPFRTANRLLARKFETGISQALRVKTLSQKEMKQLSDLSSSLVRIAKSQQEKKNGKFFIDDIMSIAIQARKEEEYEIYYDIYNLYKNRIFIPFSKKETLVDVEEIKKRVTPIEKEPKGTEKATPLEERKTIRGIFIPDLEDEEYEKIGQELESMSLANQKLFLNKIMFSPDEKRPKIVRKILKEREKLQTKLNKKLLDIEKLLQKDSPLFDEIFHKMEASKEILEELGDEEKASVTAMDIQQILQKFDNVKEIKDLRLKASKIAKEAKTANGNQEFMKAAVLYRKSARIYVEIGNFEDAERLGEIASYTEQKAK